jgi:predicted enzyme related to lactoylglutathione lyase
MSGCNSSGDSKVANSSQVPDIIATNAFYYYEDVDEAWVFYRDVLGFETVVDYGFAKILRLAETSYITLVAADSGMHSADEPKTVTLRLITDELDAWYQHFLDSGVSMHGDTVERPVQRFVAIDPEGYYLQFERFNPHANSPSYVAEIAQQAPLRSSLGDFGVRAAIYSIYMNELQRAHDFYSRLLRRPVARRPSGDLLIHVAGSGFLRLVDGADDLHVASEENGVTISFFTTDVDAWFDRAAAMPGFELRTPEVLNESDLVRVFVGYDPEGIFLEWDTFLALPENRKLSEYLDRAKFRN